MTIHVNPPFLDSFPQIGRGYLWRVDRRQPFIGSCTTCRSADHFLISFGQKAHGDPRRTGTSGTSGTSATWTSMKVDELPFQHHQTSSNIGEFPVRKSGPRLSRAKFSQCSWEVWVQSYCEILRDPQWDAWPRPLAPEVSRWKIKPSELKNGEDQMFSVRLPCWMMGFAENLRKYGRETMGKHKEMRKAMHLVLMECGSG